MLKLLFNNWHGLGGEPPFFYGNDSRELYEYNLKVQPEDWVWRTKSVRYTINSNGYRCPEFNEINWGESIVMFGCSYTFAPGVDDSETMPSVISQKIGVPVINLGQGATDDLFQFVNTNLLYAAGVRPRAVIYLWPGIHRLTEFEGNSNVRNWGVWNCHENKMALHWITNDVHIREFLGYLSLSVRNLWSCPVLEYHPYLHKDEKGNRIVNLHQINLYKNEISEILPSDTWPTIKCWGHVFDAARDVAKEGNYHPGPKTLSTWADRIINDLNDVLKF